MRIEVVLNNAAGTLAGSRVENSVTLIREAFEAAGHQVACVAVQSDGLRTSLERARHGAADAVIVGGGDGSIATAVRVLAGSDKILGVLPLGTMNLLARDLDVPFDLAEAVAALAEGTVETIDLAEVNGLPFLNNSVIGLYPRMVRERETQRAARRLRKWPAMALATVKAVLTHRRLEVVLAVESEVRRVGTPVLAVSNNAYDEGFGPILRRSSLSAGTLAIYVAKHRTRMGLIRLMIGFLTGSWQRDPQLDVMLATDCTVYSRRATIQTADDGEVHRLTPPLHYRIRPGALRVLRPKRRAEVAEDRPSLSGGAARA